VLAVDLNAVRYDPASRAGHVESYFIKANDPAGERAIWIKATIFVSRSEPDRPLAEGWAIAFDRRGGRARHVAVKHTLPFEATSFSRAGLGIHWTHPRAVAANGARPDGLAIEPGKTEGRISLREHRIAWNLRFSTDAPPLVPFPYEGMYKAPFPKVKTCTPTPDARFEGEIFVDGERWDIDGFRGMQGHNWGRSHAEKYAWCHANIWDEDDDFILESMSARVALGPVSTPLITLVCVRPRGVAYDFNHPGDLVHATSDVGLRRWAFTASNSRARIEGEIEAKTHDFVGLFYPNPDGPMTYCLNTKLAHARVRFQPSGGTPLSLTSRAAALEIGTRDEEHGVRMYV